MHFRQRLFFLAVLILAVALSGGTMADEWLRLGVGRTTDTTPVEVRVDGRLFVIPHNYFIYPPRRDGKEDDGFLLQVLLPDLEPYTAENAEDCHGAGVGRAMNLLLKGGQKVRPLGELFELKLEGLSVAPASAATFTLTHISDKWGADIFAYKQGDEVTSYVYCPPLSFVKGYNPSHDQHGYCNHLFKWYGYGINLHGTDYRANCRPDQRLQHCPPGPYRC